jgi:hypothetical protein
MSYNALRDAPISWPRVRRQYLLHGSCWTIVHRETLMRSEIAPQATRTRDSRHADRRWTRNFRLAQSRQFFVVSPDAAGQWQLAVSDTDRVYGPFACRNAALDEARRQADPGRPFEIHVLDQDSTLITILTCAGRPRWV